MKVFIINPSSLVGTRAGVYSDTMFPMPPLGLAYVAAIARALGHEVALEDQYASRLSAEEAADAALRHGADVVGIACMTPNLPMTGALVSALRVRLPDSHITLGNIHPTLFAREMLSELDADSVVMGEGEETFAELLTRLAEPASLSGVRGLAFRNGGGVVVNEPRPPVADLDSLPRPAWELFRLDDYLCPPRLILKKRMLSVHASRGCPWRCAFCSQNIIMPGVRRRSLEGLVEEIEFMSRELRVSAFGFQDAIFPLTEREGLEFCRLMTERGLHNRMRWFTETRPDLVTRELLRELKRCGCVFIMFGFESGCGRHLEAAGKGFTLEQSLEAARLMRELKFHAYGLFMIGFPNETADEARETIAFAKRLDCIVASFSRVTPYPGTELYGRYRETFPADIRPWQWNNQYRSAPGEPMWQLPGLSHAEITELLREAMLRYYLRPLMIFRHLRHGLFTPGEIFKGARHLLRDLFSRLTERKVV